MAGPDPFEYPVTLPELGVVVQEKVVPATSEARLILVGALEQIAFDKGEVVSSGTGLTVTTKVVSLAVQPLRDALIV